MFLLGSWQGDDNDVVKQGEKIGDFENQGQ